MNFVEWYVTTMYRLHELKYNDYFYEFISMYMYCVGVCRVSIFLSRSSNVLCRGIIRPQAPQTCCDNSLLPATWERHQNYIHNESLIATIGNTWVSWEWSSEKLTIKTYSQTVFFLNLSEFLILQLSNEVLPKNLLVKPATFPICIFYCQYIQLHPSLFSLQTLPWSTSIHHSAKLREKQRLREKFYLQVYAKK